MYFKIHVVGDKFGEALFTTNILPEVLSASSCEMDIKVVGYDEFKKPLYDGYTVTWSEFQRTIGNKVLG